MKRKVSLPMILGAALILCSLCVLAVFQLRISAGDRNCRQIADALAARLPQRTAGVPGVSPTADMPVLELDGTDWVALVELPAYGVVLPVADRWDSGGLAASPARFTGSCYENTLVIGGVDSPRQFGFCDTVGHGDLVTVTDMTGVQFSYTVVDIDRAKHADAAWLTGADCDLTLFCRNVHTVEYIAVRCAFNGG